MEYKFMLGEAEYYISLADYKQFCIDCEKLCKRPPELIIKEKHQTFFLVKRESETVAVFSVFPVAQDEENPSYYKYILTSFEVDRKITAETFGIDLLEEVLAFLSTSYIRNPYGPSQVFVVTNNPAIKRNLETTNLLKDISRISVAIIVRHKPDDTLMLALSCFRYAFKTNYNCLFDRKVAVKYPNYKLFSLFGNKVCQIPSGI